MSGVSKARRTRFLQAHPFCCFCGGNTPTETEDHIPARSMFAGKNWPDGYVFPACTKCNHASSFDEGLAAWLVRIRIAGKRTPEEEAKFARLTYEIKRRSPDIWKKIREESRVSTRKLVKQAGLDPRLFGDAPYVMTIPAEAYEAMNRYGEKLAKALHYLHTGKIVPADAVITARSYSNVEVLTSDLHQKVFAQLTDTPVIRRARKALTDQFNYQYAVVEEGEASAFWIGFGQSTAIIAFVFCDAPRYKESKIDAALTAEGLLVSAT